MNELAKRAVACKHWRWMDGMKPVDPSISYMDYPRVGSLYEESSHCMDADSCKQFSLVPDLEDDATLGCLLALVRQAYQDAYLAIERNPHWSDRKWKIDRGMRAFYGNTEAEVLIKALEAAP